MRFLVVAALAGSLGASALGAQAVSWGGAAIAVGSDPVFVGAGPSVRWIVARQVGISGLAAVGSRGGEVTGRGEVLVQFRFPSRRVGPTWYLGGGAAGQFGRGSEGYLVATAGIELPAGKRPDRIWTVEAGAGGGARILIGFRASARGRKRRTAARSRRPLRLLSA